MLDVYVFDSDLKLIGIIDSYKSLIWTSRYREVGACELYVEATTPAFSLLKIGNYLYRPDSDGTACIIERIELDTDAENGNYLIVNGVDAKQLLDRRIIWGTAFCSGSVEDFVYSQVKNAVRAGASSERQMKTSGGAYLIGIGNTNNLPAKTTEQTSYKNLGGKIREYCSTYGYGYKFTFDTSIGVLMFNMYQGSDRSETVKFSDKYENLSSSKYVDDCTNLCNVALIGGEGEGTRRAMTVFENGEEGVDRYEQFVDARDLSATTTYGELLAAYPGGNVGPVTTGVWEYTLSSINIPIISEGHLDFLQTNYPGGTVTGGVYTLTNQAIASLNTATPQSNTEVEIYPLIYDSQLQARAADSLSAFGEKISFEGTAIPNVTFEYNRDYFLGDIVSVENEYGISATARITEVTETLDENGYNIEPIFEYAEV